MLKSLRLRNLILIESCEILWENGFTVLSGETGAGKTAILEGIALIMGERADTSLIREGEEKAWIEASFEGENPSILLPLLEEGGIAWDPKEALLIRREISHTGKNRIFINCQMATLPLLQTMGRALIERIDQHAHTELRSQSAQRDLLDRFAGLEEILDTYATQWESVKECREKLDAYLLQNSIADKELSQARHAISELEDANIQPDEEESLFCEYRQLATSQELGEKIEFILRIVQENTLHRSQSTLSALAEQDPSFTEVAEQIHSVCIEIREAEHLLNQHLSRLEGNPKRYAFLEGRLSLIQHLKRKYGNVIERRQECMQRIEHFENLAEHLSISQKKLADEEKSLSLLAKKITNQRKSAAKILETKVSAELAELNMPHAHFSIEVREEGLSSFGENTIHFWLAANQGESAVLVKERASGGEMARLLFALKIALAEKNAASTLIFDEIDANVGGKSAAIIGEKLRNLGKSKQVLCITHFPQVATAADHHFSVHKEEIKGRTLTAVKVLNKKEKEEELLRMLGGNRCLGI